MTNTVKLGEVVDIKGGGTPSRSDPRYWGGPIPWATVKDFTSTCLTTTQESINADGVLKSATNIIPAGAVLVPTRMALGKAAINAVDMAINQDIKALIPKKGYSNRFLLHFLLSKADYLENEGKGATVKGITLDVLRDLDVPSLPEAEQQRIATVLDRAYGICRSGERSLALADQFLRSEFLKRFGDPVTNPMDLPLVPIKDLASVVTGNTPPRKDPANYGPGIEWIKSDNINSSLHFLTKATETLTSKGLAIARTVPAGTTLVTCIAGSPNSIGNAALADREVSFNQQINAAIPHLDVDPYFLYCQFLVGKQLIQSASTNSMKGMVSKGKFQEIKFLCPPSMEQRQFGKMFRLWIRLMTELRDRLLVSEALFGSLEQHAFKGKL
jgi:type I restriction enzyme S subunit